MSPSSSAQLGLYLFTVMHFILQECFTSWLNIFSYEKIYFYVFYIYENYVSLCVCLHVHMCVFMCVCACEHVGMHV